MSPSPKSQVMFASAFSWIGDFFVFLAFIVFKLRPLFTRRVHMHLYVHKMCGAHELCTRAEPCDWAAGAHGVTTMLGVSRRARRHTTQVMLGLSLRARWDTTLVTINMYSHSSYKKLKVKFKTIQEHFGGWNTTFQEHFQYSIYLLVHWME